VLDSAAATAWRIDAAPLWVSVKYGRTVLTVKNDPRIAWLFQPCPARYRVEFNIVAGVYPGARAAAIAREFCAHAFNHLVPLYQKM
jgi:hypothetical protein